MWWALLAQGVAALPLAALAVALPDSTVWPIWLWALAQGALAAGAAALLRLPRWWWWISLGFAPLLWAGLVLSRAIGLPPYAWLIALAVALMVFGRTDRSRVPLYLSNATTAQAVADLLTAPQGRFIDLGCGDGRLLRHLARAKPGWTFEGVEHAPLTAAWARLASRGVPNLRIRRGDMWQTDLAAFDMVYAFLSPVPMPRLWALAQRQMRPGSRLVSNSFDIPGAPVQHTITLKDTRKTRLLIYAPRG